MKYIGGIILFLISFNGASQIFSNQQLYQIDSLNAVIANPNSHDTSLVESYLVLSEILYISNIDTLKYLCEKSKLIAEKSLLKNNSEEVQKSLMKSLARALNNIGYINYSKGKIKAALNYFISSLKLQEELGNKSGIGQSLNNIGVIYFDLDQINEAIDYYERSLKIYEEIGDKDGISSSLNNLGAMYNAQGQPKEALDYSIRSLKIQEELGDKMGIANTLSNIGSLYNRQGEIIEALDYYTRGLKIQEEIADKKGISSSLNNIATIYSKQDKLEQAAIYSLRSLSISQQIGYPANIGQAASLLSIVYEKQEKGLKALEMYKLSITMRDSITNQENINAVTKQQTIYEYEKQNAIDASAYDKALAIEQKKKEKQQIFTGAISVGLGLVVIFLIFVFNRLMSARKQKALIEQQKTEVEKQKEVAELAHNELEVKNQEIMDSISYARRIQAAILPPSKQVKEYLKECFILYKPKDVVAGDFYWMEKKEGNVLFAVADCTGTGVPGAMVSVVCNNALNRSVREHGLSKPGEILDKTREIVDQEFDQSDEDVKDGMDIALCSVSGMKLEYAGAYNPLWIARNGELIEIRGDKQPIGRLDNPKPFTTHSFDLEKGDAIYIFSDGYADQFGGERGKKFKSNTFRELLLSIQDMSMEEQKVFINDSFEGWRGTLEQIDDVCVIGVRV